MLIIWRTIDDIPTPERTAKPGLFAVQSFGLVREARVGAQVRRVVFQLTRTEPTDLRRQLLFQLTRQVATDLHRRQLFPWVPTTSHGGPLRRFAFQLGRTARASAPRRFLGR